MEDKTLNPAPNKEKDGVKFTKILRQYSMIIILVLIALLFHFLTNGLIFTPINLTNLILQNSYIVLLILGVKQVWIDWVVAAIFTLYIGYDIYRSQQYPKTLDNAVDSALDIYMDIANLFIRILSILGKRND